MAVINSEKHSAEGADINQLQNNTAPQWWRDAGLKLLNFKIFFILLLQIVCGYDESLIGSLQAMKPFVKDMGTPSAAETGLLVGMFYVGAILASFPAAYIADRWGRKPTLWVACCLEIIGPVILTASSSYGVFITGRVFLGAGVTFSHCAGPSLANELSHPRLRGSLALLYNCLWSVGSIVAGWLCFGTSHMSTTWAWRIPTLLQVLPPLIVIVALFWIPESPRFLIAQDRHQEARDILVKYHANGDKDDELVNFEMEEISTTLRLENPDNGLGWSVMWATPANRQRFYIVLLIGPMLVWTGQSVISYYFSEMLTKVGITTTVQQTGINGGLSIWSFFCALFGVYLSQRFGRRTIWLASFISMLFCNIPMIALSAAYEKSPDKSIGIGFVFMLFMFDFAYNIGCNPLCYSYSIEILPYAMRSRGMVTVDFGASAGLLLNSFTNPIALASIGYYYYIVFLGTLLASTTYVYFFFPETKGLLLEEIAVLFEGEQAATVIAGIDVDGFHKRAMMEKGEDSSVIEKNTPTLTVNPLEQ